MHPAAELNLDCSIENYHGRVATQPLTVYNHLQNTPFTGTWHINPSNFFFFPSCGCLSLLHSLFSALRFFFSFSFFSSFQLLRPSLLRLFFLFGLAWGFRWSLLLVKSAFLEFASHPPFLPPFCLSVESSSKSIYAPCAVWLLISKSVHTNFAL